MKNPVLVSVLFIILFSFSACVNEKIVIDDAMRAQVDRNNAFAVQVFEKIADDGANCFFSPASISTALAMTYRGAAGETEAAMAQTLGFEANDPAFHAMFGPLSRSAEANNAGSGNTLTLANSVWLQKNFQVLDTFTSTVKDLYKAGLFSVNFADSADAAARINRWTQDRTNGLIKELLKADDISASTRLVLINAIAFLGSWKYQFDKSGTTDDPFFVEQKKSASVPTMHQKANVFYWESNGTKAVILPYKNDNLGMVVIVPAAVSPTLTKAETDAIASITGRIRDNSIGNATEVFISLPKFEIRDRTYCKKPLSALGMEIAFSDRADLSGIDGKQDLTIDEVIHEAFVRVNEEGTEASAATAVVIREKANGRQPLSLKADRPFSFFIFDASSGQVLFLGRIVEPVTGK